MVQRKVEYNEKFIVIIENKNYRTKSHTSINAYNAWNRNWQIVDK